jgi:hypothetical protein
MAAALMVSACASGGIEVDHDFDPTQDFSLYTTYSWSTDRGSLSRTLNIEEFTDARIRSAVDAELARSGLRMVDLETAELTVGYIARLEPQRERAVDDPRAADVDRYGGVYDSSPSDRVFEQGSLEVGLVDVRRNRVVWHALAQAEMDPSRDAAERERRIVRVVQEMFKTFPGR